MHFLETVCLLNLTKMECYSITYKEKNTMEKNKTLCPAEDLNPGCQRQNLKVAVFSVFWLQSYFPFFQTPMNSDEM